VGTFAGGVTTLRTKGGTNSLHGEALRIPPQRRIYANNFFLKAAGQPRPPWIQNQFGAEAGGPLRLPHTTDAIAHSGSSIWRVFGCAPESVTATVPTAAERNGDFTGINTPIMDPCAGSVNA